MICIAVVEPARGLLSKPVFAVDETVKRRVANPDCNVLADDEFQPPDSPKAIRI